MANLSVETPVLWNPLERWTGQQSFRGDEHKELKLDRV